MTDSPEGEALNAARATIESQAAELNSLRAQVEKLLPLVPFGDALSQAATANTILTDATHGKLLKLIVETAAAVLDAETASIFLIDPETEELVFAVALGQDESAVKDLRLAPGTGIAGLVAATGQPMAITGAQDDPRHAADFAARLGRRPRSLLCVPMFIDEEAIGVLELIDKRNAAGFGASDISMIGPFAAQAAMALALSRSQRTLLGLLQSAAAGPDAAHVSLVIEQSPEMQRALGLAHVVRELAARGEAEANLAAAILRSVAEYVGRRR